MRKGFVLLVIVAMLLSGCVVTTIGNGSNVNAVRGTGERVSRTIEVEDFTGLHIGGAFDVIYRYSPNIAVTVEIQENLLDYLDISASQGELHVNSLRPIAVDGGYTPRLYVHAPYIDSLSLHGSVDAVDWDPIHAQNFSINVRGASDIDLHLEVEDLHINVSGAADATLSGNTNTADIMISGAADITARDLQIREASLRVSGAGNIDITVSDMLDATVSGIGNVRYWGNPTVSSQISGMGSIRAGD